MDDVNSGNALAQIGHRIHHNLVDRVGALASAEDEQGLRIHGMPGRDMEKGFTHWHSGHLAMSEVASSFSEVYDRSRNQPRDQTISKSGNEVRLEHEGRNSA